MSFSVSTQDRDWMERAHRFTNYLAAASLYLRKNFFLEQKLTEEHIKHRIIGHWGTVPGLSLIYSAIQVLIKNTGQSTLAVWGPGHGAPAVLSHLFLEGSLETFHSNYPRTKKGAERLIKDFSWPGGFPSHTYPGLPGSIHEGGELGYSLGTAFGAAFDNPGLLSVVVIGDGEAETGALASSWQSIKFYNPITDGFVLPIVHLNGYKISNPSILATMSDEELSGYFKSLGYQPHFINQHESVDVYADTLQVFATAYSDLLGLRKTWKEGEVPTLPVILLRTKKGWTGPKQLGSQILEDNNYSHGIPLKHPRTVARELMLLEDWLSSYTPSEFFVGQKLKEEYISGLPYLEQTLGMQLLAGRNKPLDLVMPIRHDSQKGRGVEEASSLVRAGEVLQQVMTHEHNTQHMRVFSPDETESNLIEDLVEKVDKRYLWPIRPQDKNISAYGRVMEILSETTLQSWMQGYNLTGRHGILFSYEAFFSIIQSQVEQYLKFLNQTVAFKWREKLPPMIYLSTSTLWRQEHNGYTHQNPSFLHTLLSKNSDFVQAHFPVDALAMEYTLKQSFAQRNSIELITAGKTMLPQWLTADEAFEQTKKGISIWKWASAFGQPDIVLVATGDYQALETLAAITILKQFVPKLKVRFVLVSTLTKEGFGTASHAVTTPENFAKYFTENCPILYNFHGYPQTVYQLLFNSNLANRIKVLGYQEKGTTTTPFAMQLMNGTSRYHVAIEAMKLVQKHSKKFDSESVQTINYLRVKADEAMRYAEDFGVDIPEVEKWQWNS